MGAYYIYLGIETKRVILFFTVVMKASLIFVFESEVGAGMSKDNKIRVGKSKVQEKKKDFTSALYQFLGPYKDTIHRDGIRLFKVVLSAILAALVMNIFLSKARLLPAGFAGVTVLIRELTMREFGIDLPFTLVYVLLNSIPAIIAFFYVGRKFMILSVIHIVVYSIMVDIIPVRPLVDDMFLNTVFAAIINSFAATIALNANASAGGTDFVAMIFSTKYNIQTWNYIFIFNVMVLIISGNIFGFAPAMYSMIFQLGSTMILNNLHSRYQRKTLFIITDEKEPLCTDLMRLTKHGMTIFEGIGRYSGEVRYMVYMVVSKEDIQVIRQYIKETGKEVFMNISESSELDGRFHIEPLD